MKEKKPSEVIEDFITYLGQCKDSYEEAASIVAGEDKRLQDLLHAIEFAPNSQEKNKTATKFQRSRIRRRKAKDKVLELEKLYDFYKDQANKTMLKRLKGLIPAQKNTEAYIEGEREYKQRAGDDI